MLLPVRRFGALKNPYIIDRPLTDEDLFFGRERCFEQIREQLVDGQRLVLLFGRRFAGKTSLINQLAHRLGRPFVAHAVSLPTALGADNFCRDLILRLSTALGVAVPDWFDPNLNPESTIGAFLQSVFPSDESNVHLICLDDVPVSAFGAGQPWETGARLLKRALAHVPGVAVLIAVEGHAAELPAGSTAANDYPTVSLGALSETEAEDLLMTLPRGSLALDYQIVHQFHNLAAGEPFLLQAFGHETFVLRAQAGWAGLGVVELVMERVLVLAAPVFELLWAASSPAECVILAALVEMTGRNQMGTPRDVVRHMEHLEVRIPIEDAQQAMARLADRDILQRLGGETYRLQCELFRQWIKAEHPALATVQATHRYRRLRVRPVSPLRHKRVDWLGILLWLIVGALLAAVVLVWRSRETDVVWTAEATPDLAATEQAETASAAATPESGVLPGQIVYMEKETADDTWDIYRMRSDGSDPVRLTTDPANDSLPVWSPDGRQIVFVSDRDGNREIYRMSADGSQQVNLTKHAADDWTPSWSPDGQQVVFASFRDGNWELYIMNADGSNVRRLTRNNAADYSPAWSPDGNRIAFVSDRDGNLEIYVMNADGSGQQRFTNDPATDQSPIWSPDGSRIAWESYRDDNMEIYSAQLDGSDLKNLTQDAYANDHGPTWSPWGNHIAYYSNRNGGWDIFVLDLETGRRVDLTISEALEQGPNWGH